jgi:hypothetical protein
VLVPLLPIVVLGLLAAVGVFGGVPLKTMTLDVAAAAGVHPFTGVLSTLGILAWCVTAAVCGFTVVALRRAASPEVVRFLFASAALTAWLLFDDLFMFHEYLAPRHLGLRERVVFLFLGVMVVGYLAAFGRTILGTDYRPLVLSFALLGSSVAMDGASRWLGWLGAWAFFLEDSLKWLGICAWCGYFLMTCGRFVGKSVVSRGGGEAMQGARPTVSSSRRGMASAWPDRAAFVKIARKGRPPRSGTSSRIVRFRVVRFASGFGPPR